MKEQEYTPSLTKSVRYSLLYSTSVSLSSFERYSITVLIVLFPDNLITEIPAFPGAEANAAIIIIDP